MEENNRLISDCALCGAMYVRERLERAGVKVPRDVREDIYIACKAAIESYIIERNRMLRRLYPLGGN